MASKLSAGGGATVVAAGTGNVLARDLVRDDVRGGGAPAADDE
jgi:hypothetical protein